MRRLLLTILAMVGCTADPVYLFSRTDLSDREWQAVDDASDILGHPIELVEGPYGAVEVVWWHYARTADGEIVAGLAPSRQPPCRRMVYSMPRGHSLAHEIGHAMRLDHADDPGDVMAPDTWREPVAFEDQDRFASSVRRLGLCTVER